MAVVKGVTSLWYRICCLFMTQKKLSTDMYKVSHTAIPLSRWKDRGRAYDSMRRRDGEIHPYYRQYRRTYVLQARRTYWGDVRLESPHRWRHARRIQRPPTVGQRYAQAPFYHRITWLYHRRCWSRTQLHSDYPVVLSNNFSASVKGIAEFGHRISSMSQEDRISQLHRKIWYRSYPIELRTLKFQRHHLPVSCWRSVRYMPK